MQKNIAEEIQRLLEKKDALEAESKKAISAFVNDDDIKILKEKMGNRFIQITAQQMMDSINNDLEKVRSKLDEYICEHAYCMESMLTRAFRDIIMDVVNKFFGGYSELPYEHRVLIHGMIEESVQNLLKKIKTGH